MLAISIGIIIYLVRVKQVGKGVLPGGWYPLPGDTLVEEFRDEEKKEEVFNDSEDNL